MIALFTDFGITGPYLGQMKAVLLESSPTHSIIDLMVDAPSFNPKASAYLLAAISQSLPAQTVCICVVDPGVGTTRRALAVLIDDKWFVGPDNGLLSVVAGRGESVQWYEIEWRPTQLSDSFHGRDLFAPVAVRLAEGQRVSLTKIEVPTTPDDWVDDLAEVIYIDGYGNCVTGMRASVLANSAQLSLGNHLVSYARTFAEVKVGTPFWYKNSMGLVELAVNQGDASKKLKISIGDVIGIFDD